MSSNPQGLVLGSVNAFNATVWITLLETFDPSPAQLKYCSGCTGAISNPRTGLMLSELPWIFISEKQLRSKAGQLPQHAPAPC